MATVHLGRLRGIGGFARTVAIKRLHPQFARDPEFVSMFFDEARLAARIQHPNVVSVLDVVASGGELFLVMDYVHGEALSKLLKHARASDIAVPPDIVAGILVDLLYGLDAAHEALSERGDPLNIVHRDVSPQNVLIGVDGVARVLDFGIAKAAQRAHSGTQAGQLKGKLAYMAPEQIAASSMVDRRADVYAAAVVLWEALTGQRLFQPLDTGQLIAQILTREHVPPSQLNPASPPALDAVVMRGLKRKPEERYPSARDMASELERAVPPATPRAIGAWVQRIADQALKARAASIAEIELATLGDASSTGAARGVVAQGPGGKGEPGHPGDRDPNELGDPGEAGKDAEPEAHVLPETAAPHEIPLVELRALAGVPSRWTRARWFVGGTVAVLVAVTAVAGHTRRSRVSEAPDQPVASLADRPPAESIPAPATAPEATTAAPAPAAASSASSAPQVAPTVASLTAAPTAPPPAAAAPVAIPARASQWRPAGPRGDCTPPFVVDANGVRIPKRWCS
jgi:serine/threonine-protein kinase